MAWSVTYESSVRMDLRLAAGVQESPETVTVYIREHWADDWTVATGLYCNWLAWAASPSVASAGFSWRYGVGMRPGEGAFGQVAKLDAIGWYVKVVVDVPGELDAIQWYGILCETGELAGGASVAAPGKIYREPGDARIPSGEQILVAYGLEILLDRQPIVRSWCVGPSTLSTVEIGCGLEVNPQNQAPTSGLVETVGNRSVTRGPLGPYVFAGSLAEDEHATWSTRDLLEYLVVYNKPLDFQGQDTIYVDFAPADLAYYMPTWDRPHVALDGLSLKRALDAVLDRRRGLSYTVELVAGGGFSGQDAIRIRPFSLSIDDIDVGDGDRIPGNPYRRYLDVDDAADADDVTVSASDVQRYDQVLLRGDRILCCGTISPLDATMAAGWTAAQATEYNASASEAEDYATLDRYLQERRLAEYRQSDHLARVYSYFNLPQQGVWDGKVGDGEGTSTQDYLFPFAQFGLFPEQGHEAFYAPEMKFERYIPLKTDHDYSDTRIDGGRILDNTPPGEHWEYRRPFVLLKLPDVSAAEGVRYAQVEELSAAAEVEETGDGEGRKISCSVRTQDAAPGLVLNVHGGPQHAIASADFVAPDDVDPPTAEFNWRDNLVATVALRAHRHVEIRWPASLAPDTTPVRVLHVDLGNRAQLHYVARHTVTDCIDGELVRSLGGGFVHDDRTWMTKLARLAHGWYSRQRRTLSLSCSSLAPQRMLQVGDCVGAVGEDASEVEVGTVVTALRMDLAQRRQMTHRMRIETQWAELDVLRYA